MTERRQDWSWQPMQPHDLPTVIGLAEHVHEDYPEDDAIFAERLALYPQGCFLLSAGGEPCGYILSHPWGYAAPPELNCLLGTIPSAPDTYYIHDLAILERGRGLGAGAVMTDKIAAHASSEGFDNISLVAVGGSNPFWAAQGFREVVIEALTPKLRSYDETAAFMVRQL